MSCLFWIITSFSSVGYGDIKATNSQEELFAILIEMLGIGVFGYMIGTIQTLFIEFKVKDPKTEIYTIIDLWMMQLDKAMPHTLLQKKIFKDVRDYYVKKLKHDTKTARDSSIFRKLKPRQQKIILDAIYKNKYELFKHIFDGCCMNF